MTPSIVPSISYIALVRDLLLKLMLFAETQSWTKHWEFGWRRQSAFLRRDKRAVETKLDQKQMARKRLAALRNRYS